jgi:hypothetical protein
VLRVRSNKKKLDPTLDTTPVNIFAKNNEDPTLMIMNHILTVPLGSKVGTCLHVGT